MAYNVNITLSFDTLSYLQTVSKASVSKAIRVSVMAWDMDIKAMQIGRETLGTSCVLDEAAIGRVRLVVDALGVTEGKALRLILERVEHTSYKVGVWRKDYDQGVTTKG